MKQFGFAVAILITAALALLLAYRAGKDVGYILGYRDMSPAVETRVIQDANNCLLRANIRRFELVVDEGTVMLIPRRK